MEYIAAVLLLVGFVPGLDGFRYPTGEEETRTLFSAWKSEYSKAYQNKYLEEEKYQTFKKNLVHINELNNQYRGETEFDINQFADIIPEEFKSTVLMPKRKPHKFPSNKYIKEEVAAPLPQSFDWREKKVVTSVKDQGSAGTCWAFSTVGNIEGQWALNGNPLTSLSVEQLVDCDGTQDPENNKADCGVFGGWPFLAYQYVQREGGLETEADYKYCAGGGSELCYTCPAPGYNKTLCGPPVPYCLKNESCEAKLDKSKFVPGLQVADWKAISQDETVIADQLIKLGPLSVAMDASLLQFYKSGVFNPPLCDPQSLDHAVLMVGYGVETEIVFKRPYWLIKNSWGPKWGKDGYFYIKRGAGTCGINTQVTSAVLKTN